MATADGAVARCLYGMFRDGQWPMGRRARFRPSGTAMSAVQMRLAIGSCTGGREDASTVERLEKRSLGVVGVRAGANTGPVNG
jgi:hypothetical protein